MSVPRKLFTLLASVQISVLSLGCWVAVSRVVSSLLRQPVASLVACMVLFVSADRLTAQGTFEALTFAGPGVAGYTRDGVGWSFVPVRDLFVTGVNSSAPQVSFWQGPNQLLATYTYSGPYGTLFTGPPTNFQSIPPLLLYAGQTYYVSTQNPDPTGQIFFFSFGRNGAGDFELFAPSQDLTDFACYYHSRIGEWLSPVAPPYENANYALVGPNFQYQVVPEPSSIWLVLIGAAVVRFRRRLS
jgi:hypothetical protein